MRDEDIRDVYYEDLKDKNSIARSSRVAYQTKSSLRNKPTKLNLKRGRPKMLKVNYTEYMPYKKFKELPEDLKKGYFQYIVDKYQVWYTALARMWSGEVSAETIRKRFDELGIVSAVTIGCHPKQENIKRFLADYQKPGIKYRELDETTEEITTPITPAHTVVEHIDGSLIFTSKDRNLLEEDFHEFLQWFEGDDTLTVRVSISREKR